MRGKKLRQRERAPFDAGVSVHSQTINLKKRDNELEIKRIDQSAEIRDRFPLRGYEQHSFGT